MDSWRSSLLKCLDQTRGWFYTLTILSTALFDQPAFKNVIVNGMVSPKTARNEQATQNYTPPDELMETLVPMLFASI